MDPIIEANRDSAARDMIGSLEHQWETFPLDGDVIATSHLELALENFTTRMALIEALATGRDPSRALDDALRILSYR